MTNAEIIYYDGIMRLKLIICLLFAVVLFPLQANAQTNVSGTDSADLMMLKKDELRARRQEAREVMQARREEFRRRVQTLHDQRRRSIVERIDTRMASANKKATARFSAVLEKIQSILNKIIEKAGLFKTKGADTTALDSATSSAQITIDNAKAIVASQSAMVYVIQIASESALRENVGSTVSELRLDLRDAHKAVIDAKQAVMNAAMELAKIRRSATGSAQ